MDHTNPTERLGRQIVSCDKCPRLRAHCEQTALKKTARFRDQDYWGRPVPNFGDPDARLLIVGLAPAAHGANRTGRMFTGDRSGDWLFRAMHAGGFASQPTATDTNDGLKLHDVMITATAHCAPPGNKPTPAEIANCAPWLDQTFDLLSDLRIVLCLGRIALDATLNLYKRKGLIVKKSPYPFAHATEHRIPDAPMILCSYHPSQQNTFTGRLTQEMFQNVFDSARTVLAGR